jgi:hypothetical protein
MCHTRKRQRGHFRMPPHGLMRCDAAVAELADAPALEAGGVPWSRITPRASSILACRTIQLPQFTLY